MRLKSIKLAGFKSFVDPTTVRFPGNMSAVVGPNGCGKSNVIDAVRWVMGESSAKHLRGESMSDVIFNGSTSRKPVSQASVELIFDGCTGRISGPFAQYDELAIRRSVSRDGQSIYFINGQKTRKRDLTDLFLGTGLGPRSYAIIEQGMISRLVESRPEELRVFVEEAAGISKYKERRRDTENRIHRSRENLERLQDVRDELGRQLQALQRQARSAVRYNEFQSRSKQVEARLAAIRWQSQSRQAEALAEKVEACNQQIQDRLLGRQSREASLSASRERLAELNKSIDRGQTAFYRASGQVAECEQALKSRFETRQLARLESDRLTAELEDARIDHDREQEELGLLISDQSDISEQIEALTEILDIDQATRTEQAQILRELQGELGELQSSRRELQRESELKQSMQQQSERLLSQLEEQIVGAREELEQHDSERSDEEILILDGQIEAARSLLEINENALQVNQKDMATLRERLAETRSRVQQHRQAEESAATEKRTLERIERESSPQPEGALKRWLERIQAEGFALQPLRQSLSIDPQWEHALETILGRRLDALVLQRPQQISDLPTSLINEIPAGLQLLEQDHPEQVADAVIDTGDFIRRSGLRAPSVVNNWLKGLDATTSLQNVSDTLVTKADHLWICTPQGETAGRGWLSGDAPSRKQAGSGSATQHGVLARQRRLAELAVALETAAESRDEAETLQSDIEDDIQALELRDREINAALREATQTESRLSTSRSALTERLRRMDDARQRTNRQIESLTEKQSKERSMQAGYKAAWSDALAGIHDVDPAIENKVRTVEQAQLVFDGAASRLREQEIRLQSLRITHEGLKARKQGLESGLLKSDQIQQRAQTQIQQNDIRLADASSAIPELEKAVPGLLAARNREESALAGLRDELSALEAGIREDNSRYGTLDQELETIRAEQSVQRLELQSLQLGMEAQTEILDKLGDELDAQLELLAGENADESEAVLEHSLEVELKQLADRIQKLGAINLAAVEEFEIQQTRAEYLQLQQEDLETALSTLEEAIRKIDRETRQKFRETYDAINTGLQTLFPKVFGGGQAYLELTGDDLLDTGITIMARPPGKKNSTIHLLSGGEKALTAIALVFAIFQLNPAPFCMLDEVDAPLDDANVLRYSNIVKEMSSQVQFIYISHNKIAMERADHLLGVTMHEPGVSRLVAVDVESALAMVDQAG